jgi:hypothetical protein
LRQRKPILDLDLGGHGGQRSAEDSGPTELGDENDQTEADRADQGKESERGSAQPQQHAVLGQTQTAERAGKGLSDSEEHLYDHRPQSLRAREEGPGNPNFDSVIRLGIVNPLP